jgi:integrase
MYSIDNVGYAPATIARRLTPLRLLFTRLHRFQLIALNPLEFVRGPKLSQLSTTLWLTRDEARRVLAACQGQMLRDVRDLALIMLMLTTGLRAHEVLGLRVEDMQTVGAHTVAIVTGKGGARERVKLQPSAVTALQGYLRRAGIASGSVFRRARYHPGRSMVRGEDVYSLEGPLSYTGLTHVLQERFALAGLEKHLTAHSLRHTAITLALKGKATIPQVQAMARHANPSTTMRYAHDLDDLDDYAGDYIQL